MDCRNEPRLETDYPVTVTLLSDPRISVPGRIVNYSGTGLCLDLASPLTPGAALMVEVEDTLFLGEAVGWNTWAGAAIVIAGTALVTGFSAGALFRRTATA